MKILLTTDWYTPAVNGVVTSVVTLRRELQRLGHDVRVLTLSDTAQTVLADGVTALGSLDAGRIYPGARLRRAAAGPAVRALIAWRPDVVHSQCEFNTFALAVRIARACGAPLVHTYHTVYEDYTHYFSPNRRWGRWLARGLTRAVLAKTDAVIAPTAKIGALLRGYGVRTPVSVIPTGIDLSRFAAAPDPAQIASLRAALGIPAENRVLLFVGRLAKEKNAGELLDLRAAMGAAPVTLLLVGDGPQRAALEARAQSLGLLQNGAAVFAGMAAPQDVPQYYALGDVFVSASTSEAQGLTYLEAMAAGLPAVCRADPCLRGVLLDGQNGWQYHVPQEFAACIDALLHDEPRRRAFADAARRTADGCSAGRFAADVLRCYGEAMAQKKARDGEAVLREEFLWQSAWIG